jgi:4a-hydroxytetrahydrobiopterin dehydratase
MRTTEGETMSTLPDEAVRQRLAGGPWRLDGTVIVRELTFPDFLAAISFVNRVAEVAEAANHHPDIHVHGWNKVRLELSTHSAGGITDADLRLAGDIDGIG